MKIVVVEPDGAGGLIHYAYQLCDALSAAGADVTLITSRHYELAHLPHRFAVEPTMWLWPAIEPVRPGRWGRLWRAMRRPWRGVRYALAWRHAIGRVVELQPDIAQFATIRFPFQVWGLRRLRHAGIAVTQICHEFEPREWRGLGRRIRTTTGAVYRQFSAIFLHGESNRRSFDTAFDVDPGVTHVIPHGDESLLVRLSDGGTDARERYGIPGDRPIVLFFGGLRPSKGLEDLLEATALASREADLHLVIAGHPAGVDPSNLHAETTRLGIEDRTVIDARYIPFDEIGALLRAASVVALPYRSGTASGVLQVAYAFGRPVVVTDVGALADTVVPGATGLVVPPDDPPALARALVKMTTDEAEAERMGAHALDHGRSFGWGPIATSILDVYEELA